MKILIVNKFLYPQGGAETYILKTGDYLQKHGHEVQYFGMQDDRNLVGNELNLETHHMDFWSKNISRFLYPFRIIYSFEAKRKIQRVARQFKPDIVHFNNINYQLTPSIIDGIAELGIPMVQTVHDFQLICPNHLLLNLRRKKPCDLCVEGNKWNCAYNKCIHGSLIKSILGSIEGKLYQKRNTYNKIERFICPSYFLQSMLARDKRFQGKTEVLHNFIEINQKSEGLKKKDYVLYFGRLSEEKDITGLLRACRLCPEIPFVIAGDGPLKHLLSDLPPNVRYVGFQKGDALLRLVAQARFSLYFSVWYENCPLSVLESQSLGTPVLANRIGGIPELIIDGKTGILINEFSPENYAKQIHMLYQDREKLAVMEKGCRERSDFLTLASYCERLQQIFENILENRYKDET